MSERGVHEAAERLIGEPGDLLERRTTIIVEGKPLMCGEGGDPLAFPTRYVESALAEAQTALRGVKGAKGAILTIRITVEPYATLLNSVEGYEGR